MKILFMGTPDFAVTALRALAVRHEVVGVFTQPAKPRGRGMETRPSAVGAEAERLGLPLFAPVTLRDGGAEELIRTLAPDVAVVAAYGKLLPPEILSLPRLGCINIHASLLPRWRGAAPIQRAIMAGDRETGITTMRMDAGLDTGDIYETRRVAIAPDDDCETVHDALAAAGAKLIISTLAGIEDGTLAPHPQPSEGATYAAKIEKSDCALDFSLPSDILRDTVRALSPFPGAFAVSGRGGRERVIKFFAPVTASDEDTGCAAPGTVISADSVSVAVACASGVLRISTLLPEGKKRMTAGEAVRGRLIAQGDLLFSRRDGNGDRDSDGSGVR